MAACGLFRWHPFNRAAAPSKACVLDSGHGGMCRDGWGSDFEGTAPRPRALSPEEIDELNYAAFAEDDADVYGSEESATADAQVYGSGPFEARQENAATNFVVVPTPDMLPEAVDGEPVLHSVYGLDTSALGTLAANDALTAWLPVTPDGAHGPLSATLTAGARWLAAAASRYGSGASGSHDAAQPSLYGFRASETADARLYGLGPSDVTPCPAHGCALLAGHSGKHMDLDAREWASTKGLDMTTDEGHARNGAALPADAMAAQVSYLLATPGLPPRAVATLRRADGAFNVLDGLLRSGGPVPACWRVASDAGNYKARYVTDVYDRLSEALREDGGAPHAFTALRSACQEWKALDAALRAGAPLPEPWQR
ncbi:hypothetical protein NE857_26810 [Nocardiopsis exhalans]|uniref:Uncharacterized protein n=1 Tax=Nocardiopsis exhalans TaxID=163604 RepID=A0ABY5D3G4_9ACTN|nr:hypothetical protein [Nocardiopsis exhalans]USY18854.1 hypothetical protein NE857_26810 [Nocardiopsis exhalans]